MEIKAVVADKGAKAYACSAIGFVHVAALISSLLAFVCNESATWCTGKSYCSVPVYQSTYIYFSAMTLAAFLSSGILYILHCTAMYGKLPCSSKRKLLVELSCIGAIVFFLVFGNLFMISRTGNRVIYMTSTFFGCLAMAMFGVQLTLVLLRNYSLLIIERSESDSTDDVESNNPECPDDEFTIQMTAVKRLNIGGHSSENLSRKKNRSPTSIQISQHAADEDSDTFSSSEDK